MKVRWLKKGLVSLEQAAAYVAQDNESAAEELTQRIQDAVDNLGSFPLMGRVGRVSGTRELIISGTPYIVAYRVRGTTVEILRVLHTARRWPERF